MSEGVATTAGIEEVLAELRSRERFLLTAHEGPDGDALGSLLGMHHLLGQIGKDSVMFMAAKEFPLPIEYRFLPLEEVFHEPPSLSSDVFQWYLAAPIKLDPADGCMPVPQGPGLGVELDEEKLRRYGDR